MQKKIKILCGLICLAVLVLASYQRLAVSAAQKQIPPYILDTGRECWIHIQTDVKQDTAGEELAVYHVGLVDATSLSLSYVLAEAFAQTEVDLTVTESAKRAQTIEKLREYAEKKQVKPYDTVVLKEDGTAMLKVPQGAYLICQVITETGEEERTVIQPTLVGVPYVSDSMDSWIYELEVQLKAAQKNIATGDLQDPLLYGGLVGAMVVLLGFLFLARRRGKKV